MPITAPKAPSPIARPPKATPAFIKSPVGTLLSAISAPANMATEIAMFRMALDFTSRASALILVDNALNTPSIDETMEPTPSKTFAIRLSALHNCFVMYKIPAPAKIVPTAPQFTLLKTD